MAPSSQGVAPSSIPVSQRSSGPPPTPPSPPSPPSPPPPPPPPPRPLPPKPSTRAAGVAIVAHDVLSSSPASRAVRRGNRRSAGWTKEEDDRLRQLVAAYISTPPSITASNTWSRVASHLPRRTGKQCRERYLNQLRPGIRREPWSFEEETILNQIHARLGNKWVAISKHLPGRTDNCVKNHWNSMLRKRQRRRTALKLTEKQVCDRLSPSKCSSVSPACTSPTADNNLSSYPHSTTPSEISSHLNDFVSSGIPSPFTVSSPLTPHRDAKLQISSLVATRSSQEMLAWNSLDTVKPSASQTDLQSFVPKPPAPISASTSPVPPFTTTPLSQIALQISTPLSTATNTSEPNQSAITLRTPSPSSTKDGSGKCASASVFCTLSPNNSQEDLYDAATDIANVLASVCHPTPSANQTGTQSPHHSLEGVQKKAITKMPSRHVPSNPLAALAAAASSIPLSPPRVRRRNSTTSSSKTAAAFQNE